jgi:hypothetical protein
MGVQALSITGHIWALMGDHPALVLVAVVLVVLILPVSKE